MSGFGKKPTNSASQESPKLFWKRLVLERISNTPFFIQQIQKFNFRTSLFVNAEKRFEMDRFIWEMNIALSKPDFAGAILSLAFNNSHDMAADF